MIEIRIRTAPGQNAREHWRDRHRRVKGEREIVAWLLKGKQRPALPCVVLLRRVAPSNGLDAHDNLPGSLKGVVDGIAEWLGIDDRDPRVKWTYAQERGSWAVQVEFLPWPT